MSSLDLTPVSLSALSLSAVTPGAAGLNGPSEVGDVPVWDGNGWDFLHRVYDLRSYDAPSDGTDASAEIQEAIDAANAAGGGRVVGEPGATYVCEGVEVTSNVVLDLTGVTLKHKASSTTYCVRVTGDDAGIVGGFVDGNSPNISSNVVPVHAGGSRTRVSNVHIYDAKYDAIILNDNATHVTIDHNSIYKVNAATATGRNGINASSSLAADAPQHILVAHNHVKDPGVHGIGSIGVVKWVTYIGNVIENTGSPSGDGITGYADENEYITVIGNTVKTAGNHGIHIGGNNLAVVGNTINGSTNRAIVIQSDPNEDPTQSTGALVTGNFVNSVSSSSNGDGIKVYAFSYATVSGNTVISPAAHGISVIDCADWVVSGNTVRDAGVTGIRVAGSPRGAITGNGVHSPGGGGILIRDLTRPDATVVGSTDIAVTGNVVTGAALTGIQSADANTDRVLVANNVLRDITGTAVSLTGSGNQIGANLGVTPTAYTFTNVTTDRAVDANSTTTDELADALGTLIADLRAKGIVG